MSTPLASKDARAAPLNTGAHEDGVIIDVSATTTRKAAAASAAGGSKNSPRRGSLFSVKRSITKGPRLLGRRMKHFFRDELHVDVSYKKAPPRHVAKELATMEVLSAYHRWLRGVLALLSIVVFLLSLMSVPGSAVMVNWAIIVLSFGAGLTITKIYDIKAQYSSLTNVLFEGRNVFTSPYLPLMILETLVWSIQTPPYVLFWKDFFGLLNYFIFIRLYAVVLYFNNAIYVYRTFCRAMSAITDLPLSTSFLVRTSLVFHKVRVGTTLVVLMWLTIGCMYARAEWVSLGNGLWFSFQTLATLGYGDHTPITVAGRAVAFIAWIGSFFMIAYIIVVTQAALLNTNDDNNRQVLSICHDLSHKLRDRSATVIEVAWHLHRARRGDTGTWKAKAKVYYLSLKLTFVIEALRRTRHQLRTTQMLFREPNVHPLTGITADQYNEYLHVTHRSARHLQRSKDIDRMARALKGIDAPASSLTREDIVTILDTAGTSTSGSVVDAEDSFTFGAAGAGGAPGVDSAEIIEGWKRRVDGLEEKCASLTALINTLAASSTTMPPSMAQSQM